MAGFDFGSIAQALADTKGSGVSFEGQAKNWGSEAEGNKDNDFCLFYSMPMLDFIN